MPLLDKKHLKLKSQKKWWTEDTKDDVNVEGPFRCIGISEYVPEFIPEYVPYVPEFSVRF